MRLSRLQLAAVIVGVAVVASVAPVAAQTVIQYARNAGHLNGMTAVHSEASRSHRSGKLVATNKHGYLPSGIVKRVPRADDSDKLDGRSAAAFPSQCGDGAVLGRAVVSADVSSTYEDVPGFATVVGGPINTKTGTQCHLYPAQAEHVSTGVYRVHLASIYEQASSCSAGLPATEAAAIVTPRSDAGTPLIATYRPVCNTASGNEVVDEVDISDTTGSPADATFAIELISTGGIPIP